MVRKVMIGMGERVCLTPSPMCNPRDDESETYEVGGTDSVKEDIQEKMSASEADGERQFGVN